MRATRPPCLSVVIPTKNEEANVAACIRAFDAVRDLVEVIVVDNASTDRTREIAASLGARVLEKGPERSAQRNAGWREAQADWVIVLDADMVVPPGLLAEVLDVVSRPPDAPAAPQACWIPEVRTGRGLRTKARNFERSFYDGTAVDALRLFRKSVLDATGGYDETLIAGCRTRSSTTSGSSPSRACSRRRRITRSRWRPTGRSGGGIRP